MKAFNLNEQFESLPFAFRQMLTALLESRHTTSLGKHLLKGQSKELELFSLKSLFPLRIEEVYRDIEAFVTRGA